MTAARAWGLLGLVAFAGVARPSQSQTSDGLSLAPAVGHPSAAALASARTKQLVMREPEGPESVVLNADEVASLIEAGLDAGARRALDSIEVHLATGRIAFHAYVVNATWDTVLGPASVMLGPRERISVAGPARAIRAGVVAWQPDSVVIRSFTFPAAAIPHLVNQLTGRSDGSVPIAVPPTVRQIHIWPFGVSFSRRAS